MPVDPAAARVAVAAVPGRWCLCRRWRRRLRGRARNLALAALCRVRLVRGPAAAGVAPEACLVLDVYLGCEPRNAAARVRVREHLRTRGPLRLLTAVGRHELPARPEREARLIRRAGRVRVRLLPERHAAAGHLSDHHKDAERSAGYGWCQREAGELFQCLHGVWQHVRQAGCEQNAGRQGVATCDQPIHGVPTAVGSLQPSCHRASSNSKHAAAQGPQGLNQLERRHPGHCHLRLRAAVCRGLALLNLE
mmetsp:Transcript_107556/g.304143  ORF Transcript_107556/g.304143 Transcript_107556/m.304143 type:complete len:250 (-) Transcript_107556:12-761(-)